MAHDEKRRKLTYRSPEVIHLGDAVSLTDGVKILTGDTPSTGHQSDVEVTRPGGVMTGKKPATKKAVVK